MVCLLRAAPCKRALQHLLAARAPDVTLTPYFFSKAAMSGAHVVRCAEVYQVELAFHLGAFH
jgi:hypothetical protein